MPEQKKRITSQFLQVVQISQDNRIDRLLVPVLLAIGVLYAGTQVLRGNWLNVLLPGWSVALLLILATSRPLQEHILGRAFNRRHALYISLFWVYSLAWLTIFDLLADTPAQGKGSAFFYVLLLLFFALNFRMLLTLFALTPRGYRMVFSAIPIWEQLLVAINEGLAAGSLAYVGGGILAQVLQPNVFTTRIDPVYTTGLIGVLLLYYLGMQVMWVQHWNDWLSNSVIWVRLARLFAPLALIVLTMEILRRMERISDPRTANLLGTQATDLAVLALTPIIWMVIAVIVILVYTSRRGLRQRFLPDELLAEIPDPLRRWLQSVSDMDMLLILGVLSTSIPVQLFLLEDDQVGILDTLRQQIFQQGQALIDTSEQALAVLFTVPFYVVIIALLAMYALALSRASLSAEKRNELVTKLPNGFLILLIIALYLCAIPFTQVLTEGRLPKLPQDLGRILAFYVVIPLILLYAHYYFLVRIPYARGQGRWRVRSEALIRSQLAETEAGIEQLSQQIKILEKDWYDSRATQSPTSTLRRLDILYRQVEINSQRDTLNMNRLRVLAQLQALTENDMEVPLAIAKLPNRVVRYGIPLLLGINIYQWAVVNGGLREITNNPNLNIVEFFQIILQQTQF